MNKLLVLLLFISFNGFAGWQLQPDRSSISFVSTKQLHVREVHQIRHFETAVKDGKEISLSMDLSSVETGIPIRNERMKSMLFDVSKFRYATLTIALPKPIAEYRTTSVESLTATLSVRGAEARLPVELLLIPNSNGITATLFKPLIINAGQFGLIEGVEALKEVAGLTSIGYSVPVYATISLVKN